jgi:hypothetical protein
MFQYIEEYAKHAVLNIGQAAQGIRYFYSHPDVDRVARRGSVRHFRLSVALRSKRVVNDLFFALLPPRWHHSKEELAYMTHVSFGRWFLCGYCAWRFTETGEYKAHLPPDIDRRWDPRCEHDPNADVD